MIDLKHRLEFVEPSSLGANPANWRTHGPDQRAAFEGTLAEIGWLAPLIFNARTGRLLDGHMRREQAIALRLPAIPVVVVDLDEASEPKALASIDTIGLMAGIDPKAWESLLHQVDTGCSELMGLFSDLSEEWGVIPPDGPDATGDDDDDEDGFVAAPDDPEDPDDVPPDDRPVDVVYPSDNPWGIPKLDSRMQATAPVFPMTVWSTVGKRRSMTGTWLHYTADRKFESLWSKPQSLLESGPSCSVEPNYSTHPQMPRAFVLWGIYRKRWLNRWWQTKGVRTFVDLNVGEEVRDLNFLGVPADWRAFATRSHSGGDSIVSEFEAAANHVGDDRLVFLVYGGGSEVKALCAARHWFWCPEQSDSSRGKIPK